ncbi:prefoldin subunit 4 [Caerostris extrusa]|uniref:Prefoldin subunit 4 n=1 Tax=Caerostris extrusa TaxID=172846 RepID=A0AAV4RM97_CAEEX|nr:prefoldin subunit 4 [Caerostris extrusa]
MSGSSDSDMNVSFEDQQKINKFARHNARLDDIIEELKTKEHELQALEDAESDLMMTEMALVPCRIGDVLIFMTRDEAQDVIEKKKENVANLNNINFKRIDSDGENKDALLIENVLYIFITL